MYVKKNRRCIFQTVLFRNGKCTKMFSIYLINNLNKTKIDPIRGFQITNL